MAPGDARHHAATRRQGLITMTTGGREDINHVSHALGGDRRSTVAWMARLAARLAATLLTAAALPWPARQAVGGRRLRGGRRVLLAQRQLTLQIGNLFFRVGDVLFRLDDLLLSFGQSFTHVVKVALQSLIAPLQFLTAPSAPLYGISAPTRLRSLGELPTHPRQRYFTMGELSSVTLGSPSSTP